MKEIFNKNGRNTRLVNKFKIAIAVEKTRIIAGFFVFNFFRRPAPYDDLPVIPVSFPDCRPGILAVLPQSSACPRTSV